MKGILIFALVCVTFIYIKETVDSSPASYYHDCSRFCKFDHLQNKCVLKDEGMNYLCDDKVCINRSEKYYCEPLVSWGKDNGYERRNFENNGRRVILACPRTCKYDEKNCTNDCVLKHPLDRRCTSLSGKNLCDTYGIRYPENHQRIVEYEGIMPLCHEAYYQITINMGDNRYVVRCVPKN